MEKYKQIGQHMQVSPITALDSLLKEAAGNVEYLRGEVENLERLVIAGRREREEVAKILVLYNEERDRLERYTMDAMRLNLELRQARINRQQADAMVRMAKGMIEALGLVGEQRDRALRVAVEVLKAVKGEQKPAVWEGPLISARDVPADALDVTPSLEGAA